MTSKYIGDVIPNYVVTRMMKAYSLDPVITFHKLINPLEGLRVMPCRTTHREYKCDDGFRSWTYTKDSMQSSGKNVPMGTIMIVTFDKPLSLHLRPSRFRIKSIDFSCRKSVLEWTGIVKLDCSFKDNVNKTIGINHVRLVVVKVTCK